jgi:transcription antitermination factor NusG
MQLVQVQNDYRTPGPSWHALYTRHQHEKTVSQALAQKGFEVFLPLYSAARQWKDRVKQVALPLFPCYVFLRGGSERRLDVITTPGVCSFVSSAGSPLVISCEEVTALRRSIEHNLRIEPHPFLQCGDWVRVKAGPLEGIEGILTRKKNLYRLVLSVEMLGRSAAVEVDATAVERISSGRGYDHRISRTVSAPPLL